MITAVRPGSDDGTGDVDGRDMTLLPGLIDAHVHLRGAGNLGQDLRHGVTTALDMFSAPPQFTAMVRRRAAARTDEADLRSSGLMAGAVDGGSAVMLPPDPSGWRIPGLSGPQDAEQFVADRAREGSDYLKVFVENSADVSRPTLSPETVAAVCASARAHGLQTVAHAPTRWAFRTAREAGVDIPHPPAARRSSLRRRPHRPRRLPDDDHDAGAHRHGEHPRAPSPTRASSRSSTPRSSTPCARATGVACRRARQSARRTSSRRRPRTPDRAGATILAGTDANDVPGHAAAVMHGASVHLELELLGRAGLTPRDILRAATSVPATVFGLTDRGRIAPGKRADLLLVEGDPLADLTATRDVRAVWRSGVRL